MIVARSPLVSDALLKDLRRVGLKHDRWTPQAYLELAGTYLVEYARGRVEILPVPTIGHQRVTARLNNALRAAAPPGGDVLFAGTRLKVSEDTFREPDVLYIPAGWASPTENQFTERAALVAEVVSELNRDHDLETKRAEYAAAGIPEYWIVHPESRLVTVLTLNPAGDKYAVHGAFGPGQRATSVFLAGFGVDVSPLLGV
jgi:Uma2 family endonuclease